MSGQISSIVSNIMSGSTSARKEVEQALARASEVEEYNSLLSLSRERALNRADEVDARIKNGEDVGRLAGITFIAKDNILTRGGSTTAASKMLENFNSPIQASVIERLEAEGAICIGKANLDAFAHGGSTENSAYGPTKNAYDKTRVSGGSSGGSATALALDVVPFTLGSDTGGSIRQPASFNGVYGVKPTYGTVSRYGVMAMASSTDTIGCFTKSAADADLVMSVIAGQDTRDATTLPDFYKTETASAGQKIGLVSEFMGEGVDEDVKARVREYADKMKLAGHTVEEVSLPMAAYSLAVYYIVVPAEISSNLARYTGVNYGLRSEADTVERLIERSRDQGFVAENKRRILIGSYVLSSGYFDDYYLKALKARTLLVNEFNQLFESYDALISPVAPTEAFVIGENTDDPIKMYLSDVMTVPASLAGLPAISVPAGESRSGLPIGVQLIGPRKSDARLIALAKSLEGAE